MTKTSNSFPRRRVASDHSPTPEDIALERALEGLFRLAANRRLDARQSAAVGAVVTRAGYAVLRSLSDNSPISLRQVADESAMDAATASRQVMALISEGLVQRRTADGDARSVELTLTDRGQAIYEKIVRYRLRHLDNVLREWSEPDRAQLTRLVNRLAADLATEPLPR
jgi:DNA-binding MarR family transcriptional regulator